MVALRPIATVVLLAPLLACAAPAEDEAGEQSGAVQSNNDSSSSFQVGFYDQANGPHVATISKYEVKGETWASINLNRDDGRDNGLLCRASLRAKDGQGSTTDEIDYRGKKTSCQITLKQLDGALDVDATVTVNGKPSSVKERFLRRKQNALVGKYNFVSSTGSDAKSPFDALEVRTSTDEKLDVSLRAVGKAASRFTAKWTGSNYELGFTETCKVVIEPPRRSDDGRFKLVTKPLYSNPDNACPWESGTGWAEYWTKQ